MIEIIFDIKFEKKFNKINNKSTKEKIIKQLIKIKESPQIGKPMRFERKGTRELYISPYRISYFIKNKRTIYILDFYHKDNQ